MSNLMSAFRYQPFAAEKKVGRNCEVKITRPFSSLTVIQSFTMEIGEFYCLGQHGNLRVFNPDENYWRVLDKPHRQPEPPDPLLSHERNFLVECNGELLSVSMSFMAGEVDICFQVG
ncbi:hypothetical protein RHGRI_025424 [Rhododendron griersonianum]|uniref:Uncharacterized protein n=1 Tax=Rhododendron griersonianum TaxID=479676 RepID=A0AAV6IRG4_9ERIC|nr:hypothetical protein RHGRI_025424 [Rhododendron griersonianum]